MPVRNYFRALGDDAASDEDLPPDAITTPLLSRVLDEIPPPDGDDATTERIVAALQHTAREADNIIQSVLPRRTLADALAKLDEVESYLIASTDWIASSMARLMSSNNEMSGRLDA